MPIANCDFATIAMKARLPLFTLRKAYVRVYLDAFDVRIGITDFKGFLSKYRNNYGGSICLKDILVDLM